jgi:regulation of enolase protein 1 (concanavalin A-like superfamily)
MSRIARFAGKIVLVLAGAASSAGLAHAQTPTSHDGSVVAVAADPQDFVFRLDQSGSCGSDWFHIQRSRDNFKEVVAVALTAYSTNRRMIVQVVACAGNRNIISHGLSYR